MHPENSNDLQTAVLSFDGSELDWKWLTKFLQLRSRVFVKNKKWDLFNDNAHELDEYDKETSKYIVVYNEKHEKVYAGARLSPTEDPSFVSTIPNDACTFMIQDACNGLLQGLPENLCFEKPPTGPKIWELTRVVATDRKSTQAMFECGTRYLFEKNVDTCLALGSPGVMRVARGYGCNPEPIGPLVGNDTGKFLAFTCDVLASARALNITN